MWNGAPTKQKETNPTEQLGAGPFYVSSPRPPALVGSVPVPAKQRISRLESAKQPCPNYSWYLHGLKCNAKKQSSSDGFPSKPTGENNNNKTKKKKTFLTKWKLGICPFIPPRLSPAPRYTPQVTNQAWLTTPPADGSAATAAGIFGIFRGAPSAAPPSDAAAAAPPRCCLSIAHGVCSGRPSDSQPSD